MFLLTYINNNKNIISSENLILHLYVRKIMMSTDNTSKFKVKPLKKQKRMKEKHNSKDLTKETSNNSDASENISNKIEVNKKLIETKKKLNNSKNFNDNHEEIVKCKKEKSNIKKVKKKMNKEEPDDEAMPPKKRSNITSSSLEETEDAEETNEIDSKAPKQPSKRQMKKEKAQIKDNEKRIASKIEATKKGLNYVLKWKHARSEWKFEKLKQIWLMDNLLDETSIPDDIFPIVLEYFEGCKGMAREQLLKQGMDIIRKIEENGENKDEIESVAYQRARKLLQALPTET